MRCGDFGRSTAPNLGPKNLKKGTRNEEAWKFVFSEKWADEWSVHLRRGPRKGGRGMDKSIPGGMDGFEELEG